MGLKKGDILVNSTQGLKNQRLLLTNIDNIITYWSIWKDRKVKLSTRLERSLSEENTYKFVGNDVWILHEINYGILHNLVFSSNKLDFIDPFEKRKRFKLINKFDIKKFIL